MDNKLYVGNLSYNATEQDLQVLFSQAGTVEAVDVIKDRATGRPKGFAFITMSNQAEAEKAISLFNGKNFLERALTVNIARPREERPMGGSSGGNHYSSGGQSRDRNKRSGPPRRY